MRDCSAIYLPLLTSWCQISGPDFVTRPLIQTSCLDLWRYIVFVPYASHLIPGRYCTCYNYLLLTSFVCLLSVVLFGLGIVLMLWLFLLKYKQFKMEFTLWWITYSYPTIYQDLASIPLGQSRVTSRSSTIRLYNQAHRLLVTTLLLPLLIK